MSKENKNISYFRTLIFTVSAAVFSMALMALWYYKRELVVFVFAVQIGIFAIIGYCIYTIVQYEKTLDEMSNIKNFTVKFDTCPDYYIKRSDIVTGKDFCSNEYVVVDKNSPTQKKMIMKVLPYVENASGQDDNTSMPKIHNTDYMVTDGNVKREPEPTDKFMLDTFYSAELATVKDKCDVINPNVADRADGKFKGFKTVPWTYAKSRCDGLYPSDAKQLPL